jgi:hypothetical protein
MQKTKRFSPAVFGCLFMTLAIAGGCSHDPAAPQTDADVNAKVDRDIADVKARTDLNDTAKADIIRRISGMRKGPATPPPGP